MQIQPRSTIGTPEPPATRSKLDRVGVLVAHHVGVSTRITSRYQSADPARVLSDAKAAAAWGIQSGRRWEYSYMIGMDGSIFEQAGVYRAAHCLNFNTRSGGVLFLNADEVPVTPAQVASWHWLRGQMVRLGILALDHEVAPHYRYRSTSCPGIRAQPPGGPWESPTGQGRLGNLIPELLHPPKPPPPTLPEGDDVIHPINPYRNSDTRAYGPVGLAANRPYEFGLDPSKIPANAVAVALNVAMLPTGGAAGFMKVWPGGQAQPDTSVVNAEAGGAHNGATIVACPGGKFNVLVSTPAQVIIDVTAYWA